MNLKKLIGASNNFLLIAGPCVIESEKSTFDIASTLKKITAKLDIPFIFKTSYDKANRTSIKSYRGPGIKKGLKILQKIKEELNIKILTDIHNKEEVWEAAEVADIIQVPAFLCRQTDIITTAGKSGKIVNIKKGQFLSPWEVKNIIEKLESVHCKKILITERGTSFGYNNLVVDFRSIPIIKEFGYPVIFDATHSVQMPAAKGKTTGGDRRFVPYLAKASLAAGADGIFMEVHQNPDLALSDGPNMYPLNKVEELLIKLKRIFEAVQL